MVRVTVVGVGFGGLKAVREIRRRVPEARITVVAPRPEMLYYPSLVGIPVGATDPSDVRIDVRGFLARHDVDFEPAVLTGLDEGGRRVLTDHGEIANDALVIASGAESLHRPAGLEHTVAPCEGPDAAARIRERIAALDGGTIAFGFAGHPDEPTAARGGPVFEVLLSVDTQLRREGRRSQFELTFFNASTEPGSRLGERAVRRVMDEMRRRGVSTHLGQPLRGFAPGQVLTADEEIPADLIVFIPGMVGPAWARDAGLPLSPGGFIRADRSCRVLGHPGVFVVGDAGAYTGAADWLPKQGHAAEFQAITAAHNVASYLAGQPANETFREELVCIIDALDTGIMVYRSARVARAWSSPAWRVVKHALEARTRRAYGDGRRAGAGPVD